MAANEIPESTPQAVDEKINEARDSFGERVGRVRERMGDVAENVRSRASHLRERIRETEWSDVTQNATEYVRNNPGKALGVALGVGFALGLLFRRRDD